MDTARFARLPLIVEYWVKPWIDNVGDLEFNVPFQLQGSRVTTLDQWLTDQYLRTVSENLSPSTAWGRQRVGPTTIRLTDVFLTATERGFPIAATVKTYRIAASGTGEVYGESRYDKLYFQYPGQKPPGVQLYDWPISDMRSRRDD